MKMKDRRMKMTPEAKESINELFFRFDVIYKQSLTPDFYEIVGSVGGDVERYRVYEDGSVYCK